MKWYQWAGCVVAGPALAYFLCDEFRKRNPDMFMSDADRVHVAIELDRSGCGAEQPLSLSVKNLSDKTVKSIDISVHVYERGHSTDLGFFPWPEWTKIVAPGATEELCFPLKRPYGEPVPEHPVVSAEKHAVTFYRPGEMIPR